MVASPPDGPPGAYLMRSLNSIETALELARTMTWRGVAPIVHLLDRVYDTGVRLSPRVFRPIAERLERSISLPKWCLVINPQLQ